MGCSKTGAQDRHNGKQEQQLQREKPMHAQWMVGVLSVLVCCSVKEEEGVVWSKTSHFGRQKASTFLEKTCI
jgi:hypothetical protein